MLLSGRPADAPGTCVTCVMEGARPVLAEIQALLASSSYPTPRRTSNGFDYNRAAMLLAVLEKRGQLKVSQCDAYLNIIGGLTLDEPAADLAAILALASSYLDKPIGAQVAAMGVMEAKVEKDLRNGVNRRVNCETANLTKVVDASMEQVAAIKKLQKRGILKDLPPKLRETAKLRLDNPEATLQELAAMQDPPVSKSAMNHRMRKLVALAGET